jgi:hypothetical protein
VRELAHETPSWRLSAAPIREERDPVAG